MRSDILDIKAEKRGADICVDDMQGGGTDMLIEKNVLFENEELIEKDELIKNDGLIENDKLIENDVLIENAGSGGFTHFNPEGHARMVDVTGKEKTFRTAEAEALVLMKPETVTAVKEGSIAKGDVLSVAQVAGIEGAKHTWELIPMCHQLPLGAVDISFSVETDRILIRSRVKTRSETGVEMEALTAVSTAALTVYDMCKALQKDIEITGIKLLEKTGGKSGVWKRKS